VRYGVLGTLFVSPEEAVAVPTAAKQRRLLALLLFNANQIVSVSECVEELWECDPPPSAVPTLQTYIMQLRRLLRKGRRPLMKSSERLVTRGRGYEIVVNDDEFDCLVFRDRVQRGRKALAAGDNLAAARLLSQALSSWRGPALADVEPGPLLSVQVTGIEECRLSVLQQRIEADLRLARHHELISELSVLTGQHPLHENLNSQFMLALYRAGRKVDALHVFHRLRLVLSDELGLSPSPPIRRLHEAMLADDPSLEAPSVHLDRELSLGLGAWTVQASR
jgi:SARP family transcriptional regulator, regulator of embCAB operon